MKNVERLDGVAKMLHMRMDVSYHLVNQFFDSYIDPEGSFWNHNADQWGSEGGPDRDSK